MSNSTPGMLAEADLRFLRYRLEVIGEWPPSSRKTAVTEAISRRIRSIARACPVVSALPHTGQRDLLALSYGLLDDIFLREQ